MVGLATSLLGKKSRNQKDPYHDNSIAYSAETLFGLTIPDGDRISERIAIRVLADGISTEASAEVGIQGGKSQ
jgi:hypothetical protein